MLCIFILFSDRQAEKVSKNTAFFFFLQLAITIITYIQNIHKHNLLKLVRLISNHTLILGYMLKKNT